MSAVFRARAKVANESKKAKRNHQPVESSQSVQTARRELAEEKIAAYIAKTVAAAPPLSDEQRDRLAALLHNAEVRP